MKIETENIFEKARQSICQSPARFLELAGHSPEEIDKIKRKGGIRCRAGCGSKNDALHAAPSFLEDGAIHCRKCGKVYDGVQYLVECGEAAKPIEAARMIVEDSGIRVCPRVIENVASVSKNRMPFSRKSYLYVDGLGEPYIKVERRDYGDGTKDFRQYRWDHCDKKYIPGTQGIIPIPYNAVEIKEAKTLILCEGEKCCTLLDEVLRTRAQINYLIARFLTV